ncbi:hypothetical protein HBI16_157480 [Parastagonospora nodorum]|nr:hypothetical protein HBI16_157480 [Parastagonospora nodorum]
MFAKPSLTSVTGKSNRVNSYPRRQGRCPACGLLVNQPCTDGHVDLSDEQTHHCSSQHAYTMPKRSLLNTNDLIREAIAARPSCVSTVLVNSANQVHLQALRNQQLLYKIDTRH